MEDSRELTRHGLDVAAGLAEISARIDDLPERTAAALPKPPVYQKPTLLIGILSSLATAVALWAGGSVVSLREAVAVHLHSGPHEEAARLLRSHDGRLDEMERFQLVGRRYTWERGTRNERAVLLVARACAENDGGVRGSLLAVAIEELEQLKAEPPP